MAHLSRLELTETESKQFAGELGKIMDFFNQIANVKTEGVEPMVTPVEIEDFWREDEKKNEIKTEEIMANAPSRAGNLFKVPPVV
ncbi:MAG: Asp-tRNA(Asn)/Glu-tRNA(Gln) amidotransferase subunit GatC [Bdellovibrionaceae bacterium]|nr:Asp-tRNA(Asn)/Glu-tRNA(Gln) amidotransferase subunit GatC [Pseudobdellovibrionaceae bacterium]